MTTVEFTPAATQVAQTPDGPLSPAESNIVGYLLGRRQDPEHIARSLGQDAHETNALCQRLYLRGLLTLTELQGQTFYSVR